MHFAYSGEEALGHGCAMVFSYRFFGLPSWLKSPRAKGRVAATTSAGLGPGRPNRLRHCPRLMVSAWPIAAT